MTFRLEEAFCDPNFRAEHSLLLSFEASLPRIERALIGGLQRSGAGKVCVIVDESDYQQSFSDATAAVRVNVDYSFHGARVGTGHGKFHPKCYLLLRQGAARLFVASANLTSTGLRTNLEIVDQMDLVVERSGHSSGPVELFRAFADFLALLPAVVLLPKRAAEDVESACRDLRMLLAPIAHRDVAVPKSIFLSNLEQSLLSQLRKEIPADAVTRIVAISPFYDPESAAILALANAYPTARLDVYKDSASDGDISGDHLASLGRRLRLYGISGTKLLDELPQPRRLHAKAYMFAGPEQAWLVQGSANLTAAAWLRSTVSGGNVEAVSLRHVQTSDGTDPLAAIGGTRLLRQLNAHSLAVAGLRFREPPQDTEPVATHFAIEILLASARPGSIEILCSPGPWVDASECTTATFATRDQSTAQIASVVRTAAGAVHLEVAAGSADLETMILGGLAVVVTVETSDGNGIRYRGRAWLSKTDFLGSSASARARRHALALMSERLFVDAPHLRRVAEWLAETSAMLAAELHEIEYRRRRADYVAVEGDDDREQSSTTERRPKSDSSDSLIEYPDLPDPFEDFPDSFIPLEELAFDDADEEVERLPGQDRDVSSAGMRNVVARLNIASRLIGVLFDSANRQSSDADVSGMPAQRGRLLVRSASSNEEVEAEARKQSREAAELLRSSAMDLRSAVERLARTAPTTATLASRIDAFEVLMVFLYRLELQARLWKSDAVEVCAIQRRDALTLLFSVEGWTFGTCRSWMIRAWTNPSSRVELIEQWLDQDRIARLVTVAAAGTALQSNGKAMTPELVVGLKLVTATPSFAASTTLGARLRYHAALLAEQSGGLLTADQILSVISDADISQTSGATVVRDWITAALPATTDSSDSASWLARLDGLLSRPETSENLRVVTLAVRRQIERRKAVGFLEGGGGPKPSCSECGVSLSSTRSQQIRGRVGQPEWCESCGVLLVPWAWRNPICARISEHWIQGKTASDSPSSSIVGL